MAEKLLPVVFIHGYPLDHTMWFGVIAALGAGVRSYTPDLPGFGKTAPLGGEPSIEALAHSVLDLLKRENVERAVIAGMSMGGYIALAMAEMAPQKFAGLALISSQPFADSDETRAQRREMIKKVRSEGAYAAAKAIIPKFFAPSRADDPTYQRFPLEGAEAAGIEGVSYALEAMARRADRSSLIANAPFPTLILHGAEDKIVPLEKAREVAALNPNAFFVPVKNSGHGAVIESPDEAAAALRRFLEICSKTPNQAKSAALSDAVKAA